MNSLRSDLLELGEKKKGLEEERQALYGVLESHHVGLREPSLVDTEGFPRADLDVVTIRNTRYNIHCLNTDIERLQVQLERGLEKVFGVNGEVGSSDGLNGKGPVNGKGTVNGDVTRNGPGHADVSNESRKPDSPSSSTNTSFIVDSVSADSPAQKAGLKSGDVILKLGQVVLFSELSNYVSEMEGREIEMEVRRQGEVVCLKLRPQKWEGRGLLGCHIVPG